MLEKILTRHPWPIIVAIVIIFLSGVASWFLNPKTIDVLTHLSIATCVLLWALLDSKDQKIHVGNWQGLAIIVISPIGILIWFIRTRKWKFYLPYLYYLLLVAIGVICSILGYLITGMLFGYELSELIQYL